MTKVNVLALIGSSVTVDIGDIQPDDALYNSDKFPWRAFDEALVEYFDSLSEEELRDLYREPESITVDDPLFEYNDEVDVVMETPDDRRDRSD